ncbi:2-oxo-4-hydroxy-4-carboxy-5-ureidoimidazoline decarboxylase [Amycolatopsis sp. NPDC059021]|uniref:2-oxo-4-hydroxy-4-carboxy-5-ureidoimidazoline decarboxylase n=1 Tax=Amycolatopsis sp. NPDC059021 TaxID=3346704 RepID=UPI003670F86C
MRESSRSVLAPFHALPGAAAERELLACCASPVWAAAVAAGRPYDDVDAVLRASDMELAVLGWDEIEKALSAHPRIGERAEGQGREAAWSRREQSAAATADATVLAELAEANAEYERVFDRVFLICASGLSAAEILANLNARLGNDEQAERAVVREELRKIVRLRLERWLS